MPDLTSDSPTEEQATEQPEAIEGQEALEVEAVTAAEMAAPPEEEVVVAAEVASLSEEEEVVAAEMASPPEEEEVAAAEEAELEPGEETLLAGPSFGQRFGEVFSVLRERLGAAFAPVGERLSVALAPVREKIGTGGRAYGVYVLIGALILVALFLPPISLLERLGIVGYTTVNAENHEVSHPDGLTLGVDPEAFVGKLRVRLDSVPQLEFLEGSAGAALRKAVEPDSLPDYLEVKSPLYLIKVRGKPNQPVTIDVMVPNNAEPWETLDLYTWTGEAWEWVGSELHTEAAEQEFIRAQVTDVPANLVVMQAGSAMSTISAYIEQGENLESVATMLDEANPAGLVLSADGNIAGDPNSLPQPAEATTYAILPALRNWIPGQAVVRGPLSDVLTLPEVQKAHVTNIVQLCTERGFAGVDVDYRGVAPDNRDAFSAFIAALADALHAEGLRLAVVVEPATPTDGGWDTGGYDWRAIGAAADTVRIPFPEDPAAYVEGGEAQRLLNWAKARVSRYKLRMLVSSLSAERSSTGVDFISMEQALVPFGKAVALYGMTQVEPGGQVEFGLSGTLRSITLQEAAGTYRLEHRADDGENHTVWLGTAANLATKLRWAQRCHLGGITVAGMLNPGNAAGIVDTVASYRTTVTSLEGPGIDVTWTVSGSETIIDQQNSPLTDPSYTCPVMNITGTYSVKATIAGFDHGSVAITVAEPEPVTPVAEPDSPPTGGGGGGELDECLAAAYVADVTIPDNTKLDKGEEFVKTWRMKNTGTCAWPEDTVLAKVSSETGGPESAPVGALEPGETVDISVDMAAPDSDGVFDGQWALRVGSSDIPGGRVTVMIQAGEGAGVGAATTPVVAPVSGGSFELGGHIRDLGFPYADKMHYAGMNWAKVQVHYGDDASGIINAAHSRGFKIQLSALGTPGMVTQSGFEQSFANWVAGMAAAGADAIEVWNEPNIDREWQGEYINPQAYTRLLCTCYNAIKAANANTIVISAAPSPTGWFSQAGGAKTSNCSDGIGCGYDDLPWMTGLRDAGATQCMDYIGAHHNSGATSPSARSGHPADPGSTHHSWFFLPQTELYYNTFGGARKIFYTEMGYASQEGVSTFSDAFAWARGTTNAQQAAWLSEAVQLGINTGMVRCIIVWNIDFVRYGYDPQDGFAIIRPGGSCPACDTLHNVLGTR